MPELRWTLLILGVVFIAALAWWERRRPHQASREGAEARPLKDSTWDGAADSTSSRSMREPTLTLPEIRAREPTVPRDLPVVEVADDDSLIGLRVDGERVEEEVAQEEAASIEEAAIIEEPPLEPTVAGAAASEPELPDEFAPTQPGSDEPVVQWPPEGERRLLALRLVAMPAERFAGRALRQALAAEGFVLGKFGIFHKPDAENRTVLSAASLTNPGTFDLETMDTQRFGGLNLFAVLPGPKPPPRAFDELLVTARSLNDRLQGALQDERGGPLTPTRVAAIREGLEAETAP